MGKYKNRLLVEYNKVTTILNGSDISCKKLLLEYSHFKQEINE